MTIERHKRLMFKRMFYRVNFVKHLTRPEFEIEVKEAGNCNYKVIQFSMERDVLLAIVKESSAYYSVRRKLVKALSKE